MNQKLLRKRRQRICVLLLAAMVALTMGGCKDETEAVVGVMSDDHTITLSGTLRAGSYTLKYESEGKALPDCADICVLEITGSGADAVYDDFIAQNTAPQTATGIGVYNARNRRVGGVPFAPTFAPELGDKLYSFGVLSDVHVGYDTAEKDFKNALTYLTQTEQVSFIGITGDLTAACTTQQLSTYREIVSAYAGSTPVYAITGNHDTEQFRGNNISDSIDQYTGQPMYYSFSREDDVFIFLGNYHGFDAGRLFTREQLQWFYETLEANRNKRCFVFEHIRPDSTSGNPGNVQSVDLWDGTEAVVFEALLAHYPNVTLFHGHSHSPLDLQSEADTANYEDSLGCHSVHVPALFGARTLSTDGNNSEKYEVIEGYSEGYAVDVYENSIVIRGLDFINGKGLPIATYCLDTTTVEVEANKYVDETNTINCSTILPVWNHDMTVDGSTGVLSADENYSTTDAVLLADREEYYIHQYWNSPYPAHVYFYGSDGTVISRVRLWNNGEGEQYAGPVQLLLPDGVVSFRLRIWTEAKEPEITKDVFITHRDASLDGNNSAENMPD